MNHFLAGFTDELVKIAVEKEPAEKDGFGLLEGGMIASTIAPFMGMIGEEKALHDPHLDKSIARFSSLESLERHAKPGDIIVMSGPKDPSRPITTALSGNDWSHVQPVVGVREGKAVTLSAGRFNRRKMKALGRSDFMKMAPTLAEDMKSWGYTDAVILRPQNAMKDADMKKFVDEVIDRSRMPWDGKKGITGLARDVFVPKRVVSQKDLGKIEGQLMIRYGDMIDPTTNAKMRVPMVCKGNTCSGMAGQALHAAGGGAVINKKLPANLLPADFMRSKKYRPVGAVLKSTKATSKVLPFIARGGLGLGLAGGLYAAHENPEMVAAGAGVAGATALQGALTRRIGKAMGMSAGQANRKVPNVLRGLQSSVAATTRMGRVTPVLKHLALGSPAKILGAIAALKASQAIFGGDEETA